MTRPRRRWLFVGIAAVVMALAAGSVVAGLRWLRAGRLTSAQLRSDILALEQARDTLRVRRAELVVKDERMTGMPDTPIKVSVPTALARELIATMLTGFADRVTIELKHLRFAKAGTIRKVVTLGQYNLLVHVDRVTGRLKPGTPRITFGGNSVAIAVPVTVASGTGLARVHFQWDGRNVGGTVCGDMDVTREVRGSVVPDTYQLIGALALGATETRFMITPRVPPVKIHLKIKPSEESWAAAQQILDDKTGLCGFVLDRVDVMGAVRNVIERGFDVVLPLNRIKPMAFPVGVEPELDVRGRKVSLKVKVGHLTVTERAIWLGIDVSVAPRVRSVAR